MLLLLQRMCSSEDVLRYGDGMAVSANNLTEQHTYVRYLEQKGEISPSKAALLAFYEHCALAL